MDFVKREDQNLIDEEQYKAYIESLQKTTEMEYQHTPISMEQLHQAMQSSLQSSLNASSIVHNFQLPLSPRRMSTLMLKTTRNFNEIPAHLPRNLEMELVQNLTQELPLGLRHEDLTRNLDLTLPRLNELELQNNLTQQMLTEDMRINDLSHNLNRINDVLPQNLTMEMPQNLSHDIDLSHQLHRQNLDHLSRQNLEQELQEEARRMLPLQVNLIEQNIGQRLEETGQRLDQDVGQRLDETGQRLVQNSQRLDQNIGQRLDQLQRVIPNVTIHDGQRMDHDNLIPMPFHIKSELEDDGYFYENINQGINVNGINGHIPPHTDQVPSTTVQENQMYVYNNLQVNIPSLNALDIYSRPQNYVQNYTASRENPENLVIHRIEYQEEIKKYKYGLNAQNGGQDGGKIENKEQPKENLKPNENKIYYNDFNQVYSEKNEDSDGKLTIAEDPSLIKGEYVCYKCNEVFPSKRNLKQHAKSCTDTQENVEKLGKYTCTQCAYRCQSPAILKIHERTHSGEKPFACTFCDYKSGQKNNVAKHILVHMKEKPFRCQYCEYRCAQKNNLVVHERTHTGYKPFACPYCEYRTVQKPNLVKHMYLHTDQKPFSCDICSYRCVQKTNLTKHKQRHLNEKDGDKIEVKSQFKPYRPRQKSVKCPHCTYRCVQKTSLQKHLQFKHADLPQNLPEDLPENGENSQDVLDSDVSESVQNLSVKKDVIESEVYSQDDK